jgi:hypothetical protein
LEWAAQGFAVPKKNKQIWFVTDFRMLNRFFLCRYPFPLPSIQEIMRTVDGLTFVSILDLNMGFWTILLDKESQHYKWQHKNYVHLPTKTQRNIERWNEVHVDLIGPWMIPQHPSKNPNLSAKPDVKQLVQILALTMIDLST